MIKLQSFFALAGAFVLTAASAQSSLPQAPVKPRVDLEAEVCTAPHCVVARRGGVEVTVADIQAKADTLEPAQREALLSSSQNINQMIENLLIMRQIANEADPKSYADDPVVQARLRQVADEVIGVHQLDHIRSSRINSNFELLAKENYLANIASMKTPREVKVRHLLIGTNSRSDADALARVQELAKELATADDEKFAAAVLEHSDDPGKTSNGGIYNVPENSTELDPAFMQGALALTVQGQLSQPVKTAFGYHLIRLIDQRAAETIPFEQAKPTIIAKLKQEARRKVVMEYRAELMARGELEVFPKNLEGLIYGEEPAK